jgi:hypothetical protein
VYKRLVHAAEAVHNAVAGEYPLDGVRVDGYMAPNLSVFVQDLEMFHQGSILEHTQDQFVQQV